MAKGYNKSKAIETQKSQTDKINTSFPKNVDASPNVRIDGMVAKNIPIKYLYEAPTNWNFYNQLDENKKVELMESIDENGLMSPIIVWEINKEKVKHLYDDSDVIYDMSGFVYMVLAGHNRVDAYMKLHRITNDNKYLSIPSIVFLEGDLDEYSAKEIIVDTNYVQRILSTKERVRSVLYKYSEIENKKEKKGRVKDLVAEELGLSPTMVFNYKKLGEIIEPLQDMVYDNSLNLTSILKIADKTQDTQQWMYDTYKGVLTSKLLNKVKPYMKRNEIEKLFEKELAPKIKTKKISVEIPEEFEDEFKEMAYQWVYNKTKRD